MSPLILPAITILKRGVLVRKELVVQHASFMGALKEQKKVFEDEEFIFQAQQEIMKVLAQNQSKPFGQP